MTAPTPGRLERWLPPAAMLLVVGLSVHVVCDLIFGCGCEPVWAGGVEHCNIHTPGVPHCPWCVGGNGRLAWIGAVLFASIALAMLLARRLGANGWLRFAAGLLGYAAGAVLAGWLAAWLDGYPL